MRAYLFSEEVRKCFVFLVTRNRDNTVHYSWDYDEGLRSRRCGTNECPKVLQLKELH